ncbi:MAG: hypothetical protein HN478_13795 [Rhodospirillaceae bacterium]|jgi:malonate-semialdehyde dehydrogenase (acetylating) / methylmalonate-semialdehyde dehydrogenase|nr:hypothetical protein [Rhodospirillaceae bacterium]MBT4487561.1 hypothetical protein [Rhodospirillaceae bacterium]MBT5191222.1 hypothetical protein [Rhodospirillaceae bacterium]MBT5899241.1 hypothetical protein [Rhodospirillaceae bacterium]MBT6429253.1 hypothetical protein [Rhodospirillaceae bacterium]
MKQLNLFIGVEHGPDGAPIHTRTKTVAARRPTGIRAGAEFTMPTPGVG